MRGSGEVAFKGSPKSTLFNTALPLFYNSFEKISNSLVWLLDYCSRDIRKPMLQRDEQKVAII